MRCLSLKCKHYQIVSQEVVILLMITEDEISHQNNNFFDLSHPTTHLLHFFSLNLIHIYHIFCLKLLHFYFLYEVLLFMKHQYFHWYIPKWSCSRPMLCKWVKSSKDVRCIVHFHIYYLPQCFTMPIYKAVVLCCNQHYLHASL